MEEHQTFGLISVVNHSSFGHSNATFESNEHLELY